MAACRPLSSDAMSSSASDQAGLALLAPGIFSESPVLAIFVPLHSTNAEADSASTALAASLSSIGCELLRVDSARGTSSSDLSHARPATHRATHVVYNKRYSDDEMAAVSSGGAFHSGHNLSSLIRVGPSVWSSFDHAACLNPELHPSLHFFADIAQLDADALAQYETFAKKQMAATSAALPPPPPPPSPPCIPAPARCDVAAATSTSHQLTFASWNCLSADYAHPTTFFYCEPAHLQWSHRQPRIMAALARTAADIECMQEVDFDAVECGSFDSPAHGSVFLRRPNHKRDGLLLRWNEDQLELLDLPFMPTLDAKFAKHATERKRDAMGFRVQARGRPTVTTLQPRQKKPPRSTQTVAASEAASSTPSTTSRPQHSAERNLMKRQSHVLERLSGLEARLDVVRTKLQQQRRQEHAHLQLHQEDAENAHGDDTSTSAAAAAPSAVPSSHVHSQSPATIAPPSSFHAVHLNDLSLLSRSKRNCTSSIHARFRKENIGLCILLRHRATGRLILVAGAHIHWNPKLDDIKVAQAMLLAQQVEELARLVHLQHPDQVVSVLMGGDFNSTPKSEVYKLLTTGRADIPVAPLQPPSPIVSSPFHDIVFAPRDEDADATAAVSSHALLTNGESEGTAPTNGKLRLLLDSTLLRTTKWLRAIGVDTVCRSSTCATAEESVNEAVESFFAIAKTEGRVIVTQNKSLLSRRGLPAAHYHISSSLKDPLEIFQDICTTLGLGWSLADFYSRCTTCNSLVHQLAHSEYRLLPFLPDAYKLGFDDDGAPLFITRCSGVQCARVRWWSSAEQRDTRQALFKVRLDMDVDLAEVAAAELGVPGSELETQAEPEFESEGDVEEEGVENDAPSPTASSADLPSASASPAPTPILNSAANLSPADIASVRAARKAAKQSSKADRSSKAVQRKVLNASRVNFNSNLEASALRGDDGDYLFDQKPSAPRDLQKVTPPPAELEKTHVHSFRCVANALCRASLAAATADKALREAGGDASIVAPPDVVVEAAPSMGDSGELWWTSAKKAKMISVEQRIIQETRRAILARRKRKEMEAAAAQAAMDARIAAAALGASNPSRASTGALQLAASSDALDAAPSFALALHHYWQSVIDRRLTPGAAPSSVHSHGLALSSAYASSTAGEPAFTNCTPAFMDTIDYLFYSRANLRVVSVRDLPTAAQLEADSVVGYPTEHLPSDHELIVAVLEFKDEEEAASC